LIKLTSFIWLITCILSFIINSITVKFSIPILKKINAFDLPNKRSSHTLPTPKGAGIAIIFSFIFLYFLFIEQLNIIFLFSIIILTSISFINDYKQLSAIFRLATQSIVIFIILFFWPPIKDLTVFNYVIPIWSEKILIFFTLLWFVNLFNFMDGIDGITGIQCLIISIGTVISFYISGETSNLELFLCGFISGASVAFLIWNWFPAKVFLGDAGSIPLGFINGLLMLMLCKNDLWFVALILNSYYFSDATYTLIKRIIMRKKPWEAHKEHFYQLAIQKGAKHSTVCKIISIHGLFLIFLSIFSVLKPEPIFILSALIITGISTLYLLYYLKKKLIINLEKNNAPIN